MMRSRMQYVISKLRTDMPGALWFMALCAVLGAGAAWIGVAVVVAWMKAPVPCLVGFFVAVAALFEHEYRKPSKEREQSVYDAFGILLGLARHLRDIGQDGAVMASNDDFEIRVWRKGTEQPRTTANSE